MNTDWPEVAIRTAVPADAGQLTEIAHAAKRHWGYPDNWIEHWRGPLSITPERIVGMTTCVATAHGTPVGFCGVEFAGHDALLEHLWVLPAWMGRGVGRRLFERAEVIARQRGARCLLIESDPHAEAFYRRMGAETIDRRPAPMGAVERYLPVMRKAL